MPADSPSLPSKGSLIRDMFAAIAERYDLANHLLSGGLDFLWRRRAARLIRGWKPSRILDLATGSGDLAMAVQAACPEALVVGADFCPPMLCVAQRKGLRHLVVADGLRLPFAQGSFGAVTVAFGLRNMASWPQALVEMRRVLRPGGHLLVLEFSMPNRPPLLWLYRPYLHLILPRITALLIGEKAAYEYLGDSIEKFPRGTAMEALLSEAGFGEAASQPLSGGIVTLYTAVRRS